MLLIFFCFLFVCPFGVEGEELATGNAQWALMFEGRSLVKLPYDFSFDLSTTFTFEAWVNCPFPNDGTFKPIVARGDGTTNEHSDFVLGVSNSGILTFFMGSGAAYGCLIMTGVLEANTWYHVAFTIKTDQWQDHPALIELFLDGKQLRLSGWSTGARQLHPERSVLLGTFTNEQTHYFKGYMDEIRFWDEKRPQDKLRKYMSFSLTGEEENLRLYYDCNTKHPSVVLDKTGHHYDAQITQGPLAIRWVPSGVKLHFIQTLAVNNTVSLVLHPKGSPFSFHNFTFVIETLPDLGDLSVGFNNRIIHPYDLPFPLDFPSVQYTPPPGASGITSFRFFGMTKGLTAEGVQLREKESTKFWLKFGEPAMCLRFGCPQQCSAP